MRGQVYRGTYRQTTAPWYTGIPVIPRTPSSQLYFRYVGLLFTVLFSIATVGDQSGYGAEHKWWLLWMNWGTFFLQGGTPLLLGGGCVSTHRTPPPSLLPWCYCFALQLTKVWRHLVRLRISRKVFQFTWSLERIYNTMSMSCTIILAYSWYWR